MKINEDVLHRIVVESMQEVLNEYQQVNGKEQGKLFQFNRFNVSVQGGEHNPPHFHVRIGDEYNLKFRIDNGWFIGDESRSNEWDSVKNDIVEIAPIWLDNKNAKDKTCTNREKCIQIWNKNNPDKPYEIGYRGYENYGNPK
jgi:hypothetical protein